MSKEEIINFISILIEDAIEEAEDNGTDNIAFIPNCKEALEFLYDKNKIQQLIENKFFVNVRGGVVQDIYTNLSEDIKVIINDYDNREDIISIKNLQHKDMKLNQVY